MREIVLKEGEFIRIKGKVTMRSNMPNQQRGSSWTEKNPVILLGECKHKETQIRTWHKGCLGERIYPGKWLECAKCGQWIKDLKIPKPKGL